MSVWIALGGLAFTVLTAIIGVSMYIQSLRSDVNSLDKGVCKEITNIKEAMQVRNEFNDGVFKEIKEELRDLKNLMMEIVQRFPKRGND